MSDTMQTVSPKKRHKLPSKGAFRLKKSLRSSAFESYESVLQIVKVKSMPLGPREPLRMVSAELVVKKRRRQNWRENRRSSLTKPDVSSLLRRRS